MLKQPATFVCGFLVAALVAASPVFAQGADVGGQRPAAKPALPSPERQLSCPAHFITCMAWDKFRGAAWIGTEDYGVYEYRPWAWQGKRWVQFSKANGLSDNSCYAIAVDDKARVWAGTDRHGVDVFISRNKPWQRYDVLPLVHKGRFGPLGSHPFCITVDPYTHAVWMGTEAGISIYSTRKHGWNYLTVANGLPSDQINAIGFLAEGRVIVGTQCEGLDIGTPEPSRQVAGKNMVLSAMPGFRDPYRWQVITGPFHTPDMASGSGLPSSLINAIAVSATALPTARLSAYQLARAARHQRIYVGTDSGLAITRNGGQSWRFEQGRDYAARVLGLFHPPADFRAPPQAQLANLLSGEHITCVARDAVGNLWLGFWRDGYMVISPHGHHIYRTDGDPRFAKVDSYVQAILPLPNGKVLIGRYGHGISIINPDKLAKWLRPGRNVQLARIDRPSRMLMPVMVKFPKAAAIPTPRQIVALRNALLKIKPDNSTAPEIIPLSDDWRTRGRELGSYGRLLGFLG
ncbi:MAG: ligand-binding sensor domain-containing protein, partial [Phycisphaerae bacterium]